MKQRVITGIFGAIIFISLVILGSVPFTIFVCVLAVFAIKELLKMKDISPFSFVALISYITILNIVLPEQLSLGQMFQFSKTDSVLLLLLLLLVYTVFSKNRFTFDHVAFILLSTIYVGFGFHYFIMTRELGMAVVFFILFIIWATDSGAYFVGKAVGKHKLWPEISPNKTIEGALGGVVLALVVGSVFQMISPLFLTYWSMIIVVMTISVFGQLGDLVESALKRHYDVKDSGHILPGHGGILDRFDSLVFVMLILHLFNLL